MTHRPYGSTFRGVPTYRSPIDTVRVPIIEVGQQLSGTDVVAVLNRICQSGRVPGALFCDNGSEFTSQILDLWAHHNKVKIEFSRPGKPTDNAFIESFNGTFRDNCLNAHWFESLRDAQNEDYKLQHEYNESRPHRALGEIAPAEFARQHWFKWNQAGKYD